MNKAHSPINWQNKPSVNTPINETNLNKMDSTIGILDDRIIAHDTSKLDKSTANTMVKDVTFNESTGIFTITLLNGGTKTLDTKLEKIATNFRYDYSTQKLILTLVDGTTQEIDMSALLTQYEFTDSATIDFSVGSDGKITATIKNGSITEDMLQPNYLADIKVETAKSAQSMANAKISENNAKQSELNAKESEEKALEYSNNAQPIAQSVSGNNPTASNSTDGKVIYLKNSGYTEQDTLSGINLFDAISVYNEKDGYSVSDDGTITATVTDDDREWKYANCECKMTLSAGTYHIKLFNDNVTEHGYAGFHVILTDDTLYRGSDYKAMWNTEYTFTLTEDTDIGIMIKPFTNTFKVMLTKDIDITEYEPYCGGVASPNPNYPQDIVGLGDSGTIEVRTCGKNLVDYTSLDYHANTFGTSVAYSNGEIIITRVADINSGIYSFNEKLKNLGGKKIRTSLDVKTDTEGMQLRLNLGKTGWINKAITSDYTRYSLDFDLTNANMIIGSYPIEIYGSAVAGNMYIKNIMFEDITNTVPEDSTYEPYTETVATIPIDTLYEEDYLEVYADGSGKIVKTMGSVVYDGSSDEYWKIENTNNNVGRRFFIYHNNVKGSPDVYSYPNAKCNIVNIATPASTFNNIQGASIEAGNLSKFLIKLNGYDTLEDFISLMQSTPIKFVYELATPTETSLTAEQVEQFKQLYTFDNVTNFFCDGKLTARYYCNTDSGDTVGMIQETVDGLQKTVKEIPDTYTTQSDFDKLVGGTIGTTGTDITYTYPEYIDSEYGVSVGVNTGGTLADALENATSKITDFCATLVDYLSRVDGSTTYSFSGTDVVGSLSVLRYRLSETVYLLDISATITSIAETLSGNGPSVDLTLQDLGFDTNILTVRESQCILSSYYPLIVNGSSYCLGGGMCSVDSYGKAFSLRFLPHKNTKGSIGSNNKSVLAGTMLIQIVKQQL